MKNTTKGAIAAGSAAALLLGGAGTLAYWSDNAEVADSSVTSGSLSFSATTGADWLHDDDSSTATLIVPGDVIEREFSGTLTMTGDKIGATLEVDPTFEWAGDSALYDELDVDVVVNDGAAVTGTVVQTGNDFEGEGTATITGVIRVTFDGPGGTNASQLGTAALNDLTIQATQINTAE